MERIHNLLRKIQEIYYKKEEKQVIDIDLMLDYTRVLYADLLDARTEMLAKQGMGFHLKENVVFEEDTTVPPNAKPEEFTENNIASEEGENKADNTEQAHQNRESEAELNEPATYIEDEPEEATIAPLEAEHTEIEEEAAVTELPQQHLADEAIEPFADASVAASEIENDDSKDEEVASGSATSTATADKAQIVINDEDYSGIELEEETPVYSEIHFELPEVKDKASESPKPSFTFPKKKDIRSFIGINDKYQFMNELFANNRTAYEESLDKLSQFETYAAASDWLTAEALPQHNWQKDDETFQSLLMVTKKYFEA
jgi:hypothetical protein